MSYGQYSVAIDVPQREIIRGHLDLGGSHPNGDRIDVNSFFITVNDRPFYPIVGEFHFSRYPAAYWDESIKKMKSGGINVIASYVFWNIHERREGEFDWSSNLDLRRFAELCAENDIFLIVRMGPFCHGEIRNGGLPDWLYGQPFEVRSNDAAYLRYVDSLYSQIARQCTGLLYKDGGPIIGVQLENEYQHSAAPWEITYAGAKKEFTVAKKNSDVTHEQITQTDGHNPHAHEGKEHMAILKSLAKKHGMDVPLYTATGWGNAAIVDHGSVPVTSSYVYPFWQDPSPSPFYLFKDIHAFPDYLPVSYDSKLYPSIAAEIGPGIQVKYGRRPVVDPASIEPLMVRTIGSGSNGIGYYMYHGGSTPVFDGKYYNEAVNGIPKIHYDFQAPLGQYGQANPHFHSLKTLHMFLDAYKETIAPMQNIVPPASNTSSPEDIQTLRYAVRTDGNAGFLFMLNFQDHLAIQDQEHLDVTINPGVASVRFPSTGTFDLLKKTSAIFPFNLPFGSLLVKSATVQPLTILHDELKKHFVFYSVEGIMPEFVIDGRPTIKNAHQVKVTREVNQTVIKGKNNSVFSFQVGDDHYLVVPREMALNANKLGEKIVFSEGLVLQNKTGFRLLSRQLRNQLYVYPHTAPIKSQASTALTKAQTKYQNMSSFEYTFSPPEPILQIQQLSETKYTVSTTGELGQLNDVLLQIDYVGDRGMAFINGNLVTDHFYHEKKWEIGLRSFIDDITDNEMLLLFHPLYEDQECLIDFSQIPTFENGKYLKVHEIKVIYEYAADFIFDN